MADQIYDLIISVINGSAGRLFLSLIYNIMENIGQKSLIGLGLILIYFAFGIFMSATSENKNFSFFGIPELFADITFDSQKSSTWYNATNPTASVSVTPGALPVPVAVTIITRDSH